MAVYHKYQISFQGFSRTHTKGTHAEDMVAWESYAFLILPLTV